MKYWRPKPGQLFVHPEAMTAQQLLELMHTALNVSDDPAHGGILTNVSTRAWCPPADSRVRVVRLRTAPNAGLVR